MKVMFVANKDITLFLFRKELIQKVLEENHEVVILCPNGPKMKFFMDLGCNHIDIPIDRRGKNPFKELKTIRLINKCITKIKPDVVFTYTIKPNLYVGLIRRIRKFKFIPTVTGLGTAVNNKGLLSVAVKLLYKVSFKKAYQIFFQNKTNLEWFKEKINRYSKVVLVEGSGVNLNHFTYREMQDKKVTTFLFLGRIMKDKGIDELIEASIQLKDKYRDDIQIRVAGFFEEDYKEKFDTLREVIDYVGYLDDTREELINCTALVLPSYHEGLSNVLLEAQATGRPVIASSIPGCVETFINGVSGFAVQSKDANDLSNKMETYFLLPFTEKIEMGKNGRLNIESKFNRENVIKSYIDLLKGDGLL